MTIPQYYEYTSYDEKERSAMSLEEHNEKFPYFPRIANRVYQYGGGDSNE